MARPSNATITATTPGGIRFQWLIDNYKSKGARDASAESLEALVSWADADRFLQEAVGYTTWDAAHGAVTLARTVPLAHPFRAGFFVEDYDLSDYGAYETRSDFNNAAAAPAQDWCIYTLLFTRPKWEVRTDTELAALAAPYANLETERYTTVSEMPRPRERVISGFGFQYDSGAAEPNRWLRVNDERQFIPDYQIDLAVTWFQIPIAAIPYSGILNRLNTTNKDVIRFVTGGRTWNPGELLFKGFAKPLEVSVGADDELYYDLAYRFTAQPGGWNSYLTRDPVTGVRSYKPVRVRTVPPAVGAGIPPYNSSRFARLFQTDFDLGDPL